MNIYVLFQTDVWKSIDSRVFFGVFSSKENAQKKAKDEKLISDEADIVIIEAELDKFEEQ